MAIYEDTALPLADCIAVHILQRSSGEEARWEVCQAHRARAPHARNAPHALLQSNAIVTLSSYYDQPL
jgi:hypothetical protein